MNAVITKLADAGCDIGKGLETNYNEEELYISSQEGKQPKRNY